MRSGEIPSSSCRQVTGDCCCTFAICAGWCERLAVGGWWFVAASYGDGGELPVRDRGIRDDHEPLVSLGVGTVYAPHRIHGGSGPLARAARHLLRRLP